MFQGIFYGVSRKVQGSFKNQGCFHEEQRVFLVKFISVSKEGQKYFKEVQASIEGVSGVSKECFKEISRKCKGYCQAQPS